MSKHALEAFALCQREELALHGVAVSIVQPGGVMSQIGAKGAAGTRLRFERAAAGTRLPFVNAAQAVLAQFAPQPRLRYLVGTRREGNRVLHTLVQRLLDANDSPNMHCTRDALVALLDTPLAARG